ncbi:La-related protein 1C [Nymphaea thermarum]|nr:La-related protein 1C [Nymphaea thermarum]
MAAATDSSSAFPATPSGFSADNTQFHLPVPAQSSWSQTVRDHPGSPPGKHSPPDSGSSSPSAGSPHKLPNEANEDGSPSLKKHAWNKPCNAPGTPVVDAVAVIGAASWPALSESVKASSKSVDSAKPLGDGSVASQDPVMPQTPQRSVENSKAEENPTRNHESVNRPAHPHRRSNNTNGVNAISGAESLHDASRRQEQAQRDPSRKSNWESGSKGWGSPGHSGNVHARNPFRKGNGPYPRGNAPHHSNHGNRGNARDQDRTHYELTSNQGYGGRNIHQQQRGGPRNFIRSPAASHFMNMHRGYPTQMVYPDMGTQLYYVPGAPAEPFQGVSFVPHVPPNAFFYPAVDHQLRTMLVRQIDYYFSGENLCKDLFLRENMDRQGWVSVSVVANFNRVKQLTNSIPFILDSLRGSSVVEVQGDKIRRRNDWGTWLLPDVTSTSKEEPTAVSGPDDLVSRMRGVGLGGPVQQSEARYPIEARNEAE